MYDNHSYFPIIDNKLHNKLKIDYTGKYSISLPKDAEHISKIIKLHIKNNKTIII